MAKSIRIIQMVGIAALAVCAFFPTMRYERHPGIGRLASTHYEISAGTFVGGTDQVPSHVLRAALAAVVDAPPRYERLWHARAWYPFLLAPIWLLALLLIRFRTIVGWALLLLAVGLAVFEAIYLRSDYASFLPPPMGVVEAVAAWIAIVAILFWRRKPDRRIAAVEAAVAAQALLCVAHLLTLPLTMARPWLADYPFGDVAAAVVTNFPPAFWSACAALLVVAVPVYVRRRAAS